MFGPVSFKITLFAVDIVEMIEKAIEFGFRLIDAPAIRPCFEFASELDLEIFRGPICHGRGARSADHATVRPQW
ncbi:hypothetical protein ATE77_10655 [Sphingopyxis sp. H005]|nr:hypothetical protein ATE70_15440 [Sphingopyxis sp. H053]KTE14792.1 hypothetical protein ATE76_06235 [Sphingopyxis sp. H093]KTE29179.1 hypothetical protein ATE75_08495 [Sphingopyxis sp. H080]KTE43971.1 hypothetical protein ATE77_10655 [Sphingopyxis sp. H005]KTE69259.1 hypothetical protein ATE74_08545 [Sphingopyxis sp. H085]